MNAGVLSHENDSRDGQLRAGVHGPISIRVDLLTQHQLEYYYHLKAGSLGQAGANIRYVGHKDDLVAAGCIGTDTLAGASYNHLNRDERQRLVLSVGSKAGPGKRGWIEVGYITADSVFASSLPGVLTLFPAGVGGRARLRLVVDNTRGQP
jgi:hypothetical protein